MELPIMMSGMAVGGNSHKLSDWQFALAVIGGLKLCLMAGPISSHSDTANASYGLQLMLGCLLMGGFTSTLQRVPSGSRSLQTLPPWSCADVS